MRGFADIQSQWEATLGMRLLSWVAFFVVCNVIGVEVFKAAMTLPFEEALLPGILTIPLIGLTAVGATRVVAHWHDPRE
jgi:hypothetical protein